MNRFPVIIDCDPGVDDVAALLLARQIETMDLKAITTVSGNVEVDKTTANAKKARHAMGIAVPIFAGAEKPMFREAKHAYHFHGEDGLSGVVYDCPDSPTEEEKAWDAMYRIGKECGGELTIVAVGPMTNLGVAIAKYKDFASVVKRVVIMGGAAIGGNVTPCAEFNIYADPEAADMLFQSGIPVYMCGLDVTMNAYMTRDELEEIKALGTPQSEFFYNVTNEGLLKYIGFGHPGVAMHDPVAVLYAADDSIFTTEEAGVRVECKGELTLGKTVTDLYSDKQWEHNAYIVTGVNREAFIAKVKELMAKY